MDQINKINAVNAKLGATRGGQQTTRYIFDTVTASGAGAVYYDFFKTFSGKSEFETNLTTNKLNASESMVIKSIFVAISPGTSGTLTLTGHSLLNITVGNQVVLKDFNISFNAGNRGIAFDRLHADTAAATGQKYVEVRLATDIVIPPQVNFGASLLLAEDDAVANTSITLGLKGYGEIFSAGNSF